MRRWWPVSAVLVACSARPVVTPEGPSLLLTVDVAGQLPPRAYAVDAEGAREVVVDGSRRAILLRYSRPLDEYGLVFDAGELVLETDGVPLPPPVSWAEVDAQGELIAGDLGALPGDVLSRFRVARAPCPRLEATGAPLDLPALDIGWTVPLGEDAWVVGVHAPGQPRVFGAMTLAVVTRFGRTDLPLQTLGAGAFLERDGSVWLVATATSSSAALLCHIVPDAATSPSCQAAGDLAVLDLDGWRHADGTLELVAAVYDGDENIVAGWRGDHRDRGTWRTLLRAPRAALPGCGVATSGRVTMVGEGRAVFTPSRGESVELAIGAEVTATPLTGHPEPSCLVAWGRTPSGRELLLDLYRVGLLESGLHPEVWTRDATARAWQPYALPDDAGFGWVSALDDVLMVVRPNGNITLVDDDEARPDLPPRACSVVATTFDGWAIAGRGSVLALFSGGSISRLSRWRLARGPE